jgi:hypothetical protein
MIIGSGSAAQATSNRSRHTVQLKRVIMGC